MIAALKEVLRALGFVALHAAIVGAYLSLTSALLPPLRGEGPALVVLPGTAIAAIALALMQPIVRAARTHAARFAVYASFTAIALIAYALIFAFALSPGSNPLGVFVFVTLVELVFGAPLFLAVGASAKLTSDFLIGRPARW